MFIMELGEGFINLARHINCARYNSQVIILNEKLNEFIFFDAAQSKFFTSILGSLVQDLTREAYELALELVKADIIAIENQLVKSSCATLNNVKGVNSCSWELGDDRWTLKDLNLRTLLKAFSYLHDAEKLSGAGKLLTLTNILRDKYNSIDENEKFSREKLISIGSNVNLAIKLSRSQVHCLEFAYCVTRIAYENNIKCRFCIGVQTYPFISHAWVAYEGEVILDNPDLEKDLVKILEIGL